VASPIPFYRHAPRSLCHNWPQDATSTLTADTGNKTHHQQQTHHHYKRLYQPLHHHIIQLSFKDNHIEQLETYIGEIKKKTHNEQKHKAKFNSHLDRFMGVEPSVNNQPKVAVNHKYELGISCALI
jgi:hypothetical protein